MKNQVVFSVVWACLVGCGEPINPEDLPNIHGTWTVTESIDAAGSSCRFVGTMTIDQDGEDFLGQFTRTGQCTIAVLQGTTAAAQTGSTAHGRVGMETVDFRIGDCDYRGLIVTGDDPEQMSGTILCTTIILPNGISTSAGTWSADRIAD